VFANNVNLTLPSEIAARGFLYTARAQTPFVPADASAEEQCGKDFVRALLAKMFRRPLGADELLAAAETGKLESDLSLEAEVRRLLATPRACAATADFNRQ